MSSLWRKIFGCTKREARAEQVQKDTMEEHALTMWKIEGELKSAEEAADKSRSAAYSLLKRLSEDTPK